MDHQQRSRKNQQFRKQIRRHQLDTYFQQRRRELQQAHFLQQTNRISIQLQTNEKRLNFIQQAALQLSGDPKPQWKHTIHQLQKAVLSFKGEYQLWVSREIVKKLCLCFDMEYKDCGLWSDVAAILIDMLYCSHREQTHFVRYVMEEEIGLKIVTIASMKEFSIGFRLNYLMLMAKIIICDSRYRNNFIRDGAGSLLVEMGCQILAQKEINQKNLGKYMECIHSFVDYGNSNFNAALINLIKALISPLLQILFLDHISFFIISKCLVCLNIFIRTGKAFILSSIYTAHGVIDKILVLLSHQAKNIRLSTVQIIGRISYSDDFNKIGTDIITKGLYNALIHSYQKLQSKNNKYFVQTSMTILSNIVCQLPQEIDTIVFHPVFQIVINQMCSQVPSTQYSYAYCMHSMFQKAQYKHFEHLLKTYDTIKSFVQLLVSSNDKQVISEVCSALILIIEQSSKTYNKAFSVVQHLQGVYNITNTILHIQGKTSNKYISQNLDALLKSIQEYQYGSNECV